MKEPRQNPHVEALADSEAREHDARPEIETLREPLAVIRDAVELPDNIAAKIDAALR